MITSIFWKRTYLFIEYTANAPLHLIFVQESTGKQIAMESKILDSGKYRAKLNFAIADGRGMFPAGKWQLFFRPGSISENLRHSTTLTTVPVLSEELLFRIEDCSRVFRYGNGRSAYIVTFDVEELTDHTIGLFLEISFMKKNKKPEIRSKKAQPAIRMLNLCYSFFSTFRPKKGNRVLFLSENMDHIRDNMKAIDTRLHERGLDREFEISYFFHNIFDEKPSPAFWLKTLKQIAKNDYIFVDDYVPIFGFLNLKPHTKLIQTWHAGFGFKLVGYGRFGIDGSPHPYVSCHRKYTYALIGNPHLREIYTEVFGIEPEALLASGMPRLEHFLDEDYMRETSQALYEKYPQFSGKRVILYAPTYRGYSQDDAHFDYDCLDFVKLAEICRSTDSVFVFKMHHFIKEATPIPEELQDCIYDLSGENLNDLFYISDVLITDYSSCFYDYLLLKRPILFYVYDKALYSATRGVHRPIDQVAPGIVYNNFDELANALHKEQLTLPAAADMLIDNCLTNTDLASDMVIDFCLLGKEVPRLCEK